MYSIALKVFFMWVAANVLCNIYRWWPFLGKFLSLEGIFLTPILVPEMYVTKYSHKLYN